MDEVRGRVKALGADWTRGASAIATDALTLLADAALTSRASDAEALRAELWGLGRRLARLRPSMAAVATAVAWLLTDLERPDDDLVALRGRAADRAGALREEMARATAAAAARVAQRIVPGATVVTHSSSAACKAALLEAKTRLTGVLVTESRPGEEGRALARELADEGLPVTLIADAGIAHAVECADLALVGADAITRDGGIVNKTGTRLLALAAWEEGVPLIAVAESYKCHLAAAPPTLELGPAAMFGEVPPGVSVGNVAFEQIGGRWLAAIVTEAGTFRPARVGELFARWEPVAATLARLLAPS